MQGNLVLGEVGVGRRVVGDVETVVDQLYVILYIQRNRLVPGNLVVND